MKEVIAINVRAEFGYYKKFSSNTSPLTYSIPPKTALIGFLGALIGEFNGSNERDLYLDYLNEITCSVKTNFNLRKSFMGANFQNLKTKKAITNAEFLKLLKENPSFNADKELVNFDDFYEHTKSYDRGAKYTQVNLELLMKPSYTFFFNVENEDIKSIILDRLDKGESYYPLYLGTTDCPLEIVSYETIHFNLVSDSKDVSLLDSSFLEKQVSVVSTFKNNETEQSQVFHEKQPYLFIRENGSRRNKEFVDVVFSNSKVSVFAESYLRNEEKDLNIILY